MSADRVAAVFATLAQFTGGGAKGRPKPPRSPGRRGYPDAKDPEQVATASRVVQLRREGMNLEDVAAMTGLNRFLCGAICRRAGLARRRVA